MKRLKSIFISILLFISVVGCGKTAADGWQEQYDLGMRYLTEGNYEEAILAFTAAIEIDPKQPEAYIGAADAYELLDDLENAIKMLETGYDATGDENIAKQLQELLEQLEESKDKNLTGQSIFTLADLEEWGYPYGMTPDDLAAKGEVSASDVEKYYENIRNLGELYHNVYTSVGNNRSVLFEQATQKIGSINIEDGDSRKGPRGIEIGMSLKDVLNRFCCTNTIALQYAESLDAALFSSAESEDLIWIYRTWDEDDHWGNDYDVVCDAYLRKESDSLINLCCGTYAFGEKEYPDRCELSVDINTV